MKQNLHFIMGKKQPISYLFLVVLVFCPMLGQARPEYAIRHGFTRCTTCHLSPVGGGTRNLMGKSFGLRGFNPGPFATQDVWSLDVRGIYLNNPEGPNTLKGGAGIMAGNLSANLPVTAEEEGKAPLRAVLTHNVGGFPAGAGGPREAYLRWELKDDSATGFSPQYVLLGRFVSPFGIVTDEHRTYTKLQTQSTWNNLDIGALFSGNPSSFLHYDFSLVNGQKTNGTGFGDGNAAVWGSTLNLRLMTSESPVGFGLSGLHYEKVKDQDSASASAAYMMVSMDRLTWDVFKGSLLVEYVSAQGLNSNIDLARMFTDSAYLDTVKNSESRGLYALLNWEFSEVLSFCYKYDQYTPNLSFVADSYVRHGLGFKYYFGPNLFTLVRFEKAEAGHPSEQNISTTPPGLGASDAAWAYLQLSI